MVDEQSGAQFDEKFVAFVDILGFSEIIRSSEAGSGPSLQEILSVVDRLGTLAKRERFAESGPQTCPHAPYIRKDLDFRVTQISDCVIISAEISPSGIIAIMDYCWLAALELLIKGFLCRGYVTRGRIHHRDYQVIGTAYMDAYHKEREVSAFAKSDGERGTPFIEIDPTVCTYVSAQPDECVKQMFEQHTRSTAIFPFKSLSHSFMIADATRVFDPDKERANVKNLRMGLNQYKSRIVNHANMADREAKRKVDYYFEMLDAQLAQCDQTDKIIDQLSESFGLETPRV